MTARYEDSKVGSDRVRFAIGFEDYQEQWSDAARSEGAGARRASIFTARRKISPRKLPLRSPGPLTVSGGTSFREKSDTRLGERRHGRGSLRA